MNFPHIINKVFAANHNIGDANPIPGGAIDNPLKAGNLFDLLKDIVNIIIQFGIPVAAIFIIYAGFLFVTARGSEEKIKSAKQTFMWAVIGSAILLGSWVIVTIVQETIESLRP